MGVEIGARIRFLIIVLRGATGSLTNYLFNKAGGTCVDPTRLATTIEMRTLRNLSEGIMGRRGC